MRDYLFILLLAAAVTYLLTPLVRHGAIAAGAVKMPRERDVHTEPTPEMGGIAMYGGLVAGVLVAQRLPYLSLAFPSGSKAVPGLLAAAGLIVVIGIVDDRWGMSVISKLAGQIAAGGILAWSGVYLSWLPLPNGNILAFEPDLSYTVTILFFVVTMNAVNFIDGLDGLAAGVVGIAGLSFLVYSYNLANSVGVQSQSVPAIASAVLVGMCAGFLPYNFNPARIFMGDTGALLIGMLLAYGPVSSLVSLDPNVLTNYSHGHPLNRFPTILPLLLPVAILIIPYTDLLFAVVRRTAAGMSPFAADGKHLHHRLLNMGHSHRQSVLLMYLWTALFSATVVGLSVARTELIWLAVVTVVALALLIPATMPRLRPWRTAEGKQGRVPAAGVPTHLRGAMLTAPVPGGPVPAAANGVSPAIAGGAAPGPAPGQTGGWPAEADERARAWAASRAQAARSTRR